MSVRRCQAEVDSAEFVEWLAYSQIERFGPQMDDQRLGVVAAAIYNVGRDSKKYPDPFRAFDVFPWMAGPSAKESDEPILLDDPVAQSNLLRASLFSKKNAEKQRPDHKS